MDGPLPKAVSDVLLHYVDFGEVARTQLGMQCQYASRYLEDPEISKGIRWQGSTSDYHNITIHKDDVDTFVKKALAWRRTNGIIA